MLIMPLGCTVYSLAVLYAHALLVCAHSLHMYAHHAPGGCTVYSLAVLYAHALLVYAHALQVCSEEGRGFPVAVFDPPWDREEPRDTGVCGVDTADVRDVLRAGVGSEFYWEKPEWRSVGPMLE